MTNEKHVHLEWTGNELNLRAKFDAGYEVGMHGPSDATGATPMEFLLAAAAGCSTMDVIYILGKKRQQIESVEVEAEAIQAKDHPQAFTHGKFTYIVRGVDVDPKAVERAIELSQTSYCSASIMLKNAGMVIDTEYRIE